MARSTGEVAAASHRAVILALGASELQTQPQARGKVRCAQVTDERHLIGTVQQDLHAHMETDLSVRARQGGGPCRVPRSGATASTESAPATSVRSGTTPFFVCCCWFFLDELWKHRENTARKIYEKRYEA